MSKIMTQQEIIALVYEANANLPDRYATFIRCYWDEGNESFVFEFKANTDAQLFFNNMKTLDPLLNMNIDRLSEILYVVRDIRSPNKIVLPNPQA